MGFFCLRGFLGIQFLLTTLTFLSRRKMFRLVPPMNLSHFCDPVCVILSITGGKEFASLEFAFDFVCLSRSGIVVTN
jgi:hypothetical protein